VVSYYKSFISVTSSPVRIILALVKKAELFCGLFVVKDRNNFTVVKAVEHD